MAKKRRSWKGRTLRDKGVTAIRRTSKSGVRIVYQARIRFDGQSHYIGTFYTQREANQAYLKRLVELLTLLID